MKLATEVRRMGRQVQANPNLEDWKPLVALLVQLAVQFDAGDLPAIAVQQLRMGLKEVREAILLAKDVEGQAGHIAKLLAEYRARETSESNPG